MVEWLLVKWHPSSMDGGMTTLLVEWYTPSMDGGVTTLLVEWYPPSMDGGVTTLLVEWYPPSMNSGVTMLLIEWYPSKHSRSTISNGVYSKQYPNIPTMVCYYPNLPTNQGDTCMILPISPYKLRWYSITQVEVIRYYPSWGDMVLHKSPYKTRSVVYGNSELLQMPGHMSKFYNVFRSFCAWYHFCVWRDS